MAPRILYFTVFPLVWIGGWALIAGMSHETRPLMIGESQHFLSLAWTAWRDGGFLHVGISQDGALVAWPMVVWLIELGWFLFGVSDWWPHLIGYAAGLACVFLTAGLARLLWPGWTGLGAMSGTSLSALTVWVVLSGVLGPHVVASGFAVAALYSLVWYWRTGRWDGIVYYGLMTGGCVLTIGPVGWLVCIPCAILAPLWGGALAEQIDDDRNPPHGWRHWYISLAAGIVLSALVVLSWAGFVLFEISGEDVSILDSVVSFVQSLMPGHLEVGRHWLSVLIAVGVAVVPWILWVPAWRSLMGIKHVVFDGGARLCVLWTAGVAIPVIVFSDFDPIMATMALPPLSLLMAFLVFYRADKEVVDPSEGLRFGHGETTLGLVLVLAGAVLLVAPFAGVVFEVPWWIEGISGGWGSLLMMLGAIVAYAAPRLVDLRMMIVSVVSILVIIVGHLVAEPVLRSHFDSQPSADFVAEQLSQGNHVAFAGDYIGEFDFASRLAKNIIVLSGDDPIGRAAWIAGNPGAIVAQIVERAPDSPQPLAVFPYGERNMVFWLDDTLAADPALLDRLDGSDNNTF